MGIDSVDVITGAYPNYPDLNGGAHYYAFSPEMSNYQEAFANIVLPDKVKLIPDTGGRTDYTRNGYISLGIHGNSAGIDLGIRKTTTTNWHPCYFDMKAKQDDPDKKAGFYSYPDYEAPADATNAIIVAKPISTTSVGLYVQFLNASGRDVGRPFYDEITVAAGNLTSSGEHVSCQFYRFASLVQPNDIPDNKKDSTFMLGGKFINLKLYNRNTGNYEPWGIKTRLVQDAWKVSPERVRLSYSIDSETFGIDHWFRS